LIDENNQIITMARSLFSRNVNPKLIFFFIFPEFAKKLGIIPFDPRITGFFKAFTMRIIEERKKNPSKEKRYDFLQLMMDAVENEGDDGNGKKNIEGNGVANGGVDEEKAKAVEMSGMTPSDSADYQRVNTHNKSKKRKI